MDNISFKRKASKNSIKTDELTKIKGFTLDKNLKANDLVKAYKNIGFQASNVAKACELVAEMKKEKTAIFLSYTSNMVSSGLREIIAQLVKNKQVTAIITSTGSIEEDFMKSMFPFLLGDFEADDNEVKENKINRIGNIFVPDDYYCKFEELHMKFIEKIHKKHPIISPSDYIYELGKEIKDENSILYWATKNKIPIFCPGFVDGAMGDHWYFFNQNRKDKFIIDTTADLNKFYNMILQPEKTGGIILGGGIAKHHLIGAAILRDGLDYAVYITTATQYDGSLSGEIGRASCRERV